MATLSRPVLLFDGECGLCQSVVRAMFRFDRHGRLCFAPLQGSTAQGFLRSHGLKTTDFDSVLFVDDLGRADTAFYQRAAGVLAALRELGGGWRVLARLLAVVPVAWLDSGYRLVARWRYRVFGRQRPAPPSNSEWAGRLLD
jgi:predicted DCC family thiol-disulfide oxidoreductase YuxK